MRAATPATRVSVLTRLRDLRDWAAFIRESDQPLEPGTRDLIVAYMGEAFLRDIEADSQRVIEKLDQMINRIVSTAKPFEERHSPLQ